MRTRFIKTLKVTPSEIEAIDERVNGTISDIALNGGKIISIRTETFGLSPMNLIFIIIYESENEITDFAKGGANSDKR